MNTLEAEYSFLAPTWRLPPVATSSIYSRNYAAPYVTPGTGLGPDWVRQRSLCRFLIRFNSFR